MGRKSRQEGTKVLARLSSTGISTDRSNCLYYSELAAEHGQMGKRALSGFEDSQFEMISRRLRGQLRGVANPSAAQDRGAVELPMPSEPL
jgi:hypothetical protein